MSKQSGSSPTCGEVPQAQAVVGARGDQEEAVRSGAQRGHAARVRAGRHPRLLQGG